MPAPSSLISMTMRLERWSASNVIVPSSGFPAARLRSGISMPWSIELRMMCGERVAQPFDHRLVDLGRLTEGLEPGPFSSLDREFTNQSRHALKNRTNRLSAHGHDAVLEFTRMQENILQHLRQPALGGVVAVLQQLPKHRLRNHEFADHVDDPIDFIEIDPYGGRCRSFRLPGVALLRRRWQWGRAARQEAAPRSAAVKLILRRFPGPSALSVLRMRAGSASANDQLSLASMPVTRSRISFSSNLHSIVPAHCKYELCASKSSKVGTPSTSICS